MLELHLNDDHATPVYIAPHSVRAVMCHWPPNSDGGTRVLIDGDELLVRERPAEVAKAVRRALDVYHGMEVTAQTYVETLSDDQFVEFLADARPGTRVVSRRG